MTPGNDPESAQFYTALRVQVGQSTSSSGIGIGNILRQSWLNPKPRSAMPTTSSLSPCRETAHGIGGWMQNTQLHLEMGCRHGAL